MACNGSRLDPSPIETNDLFFWLLIDLTKPLTTTLSESVGGASRRRATDIGLKIAAVELKLLQWGRVLEIRNREDLTILLTLI
jgi:hypothetical protein